MAIENKPDLKTTIDAAITIDGIPTPVDSTDHNQVETNLNDSKVPRLSEAVSNNLASGVVDFQAAGSRGIHFFSLVNNAYEITGFSNVLVGDTIYLVIFNDFDFAFSAFFTTANSVFKGRYSKSATVPNMVRVTAVQDSLLSPFYVIEFLNEKLLEDADSYIFNTPPPTVNLAPAFLSTIDSIQFVADADMSVGISSQFALRNDHISNTAAFLLYYEIRKIGGSSMFTSVVTRSQASFTFDPGLSMVMGEHIARQGEEFEYLFRIETDQFDCTIEDLKMSAHINRKLF